MSVLRGLRWRHGRCQPTKSHTHTHTFRRVEHKPSHVYGVGGAGVFRLFRSGAGIDQFDGWTGESVRVLCVCVCVVRLAGAACRTATSTTVECRQKPSTSSSVAAAVVLIVVSSAQSTICLLYTHSCTPVPVVASVHAPRVCRRGFCTRVCRYNFPMCNKRARYGLIRCWIGGVEICARDKNVPPCRRTGTDSQVPQTCPRMIVCVCVHTLMGNLFVQAFR